MVQFFGQFWAVAIPIVAVAAGAAALLFVVCFALYRWQRFANAFRGILRVVFRRPQYDHNDIFNTYLKKFNAVTEQRELCDAILEFTASVVGAEGASLLVKNGKGTFSVRASYGTKPFTCDIPGVTGFIGWLSDRREMVTRKFLLNSKRCQEIKIEGLRYCVQFNAEACVPVFIGDTLYALLNLGARHKGDYDHETRALLCMMAVQFAGSIHNANLSQALRNQGAQLERMSSFKSQLLSNLSHELRTPLNSIIGLSELMAEGGDGTVTADQVNHLFMIRQSGQRLLDSVTSMLDLAKIEANHLELNIKHLSLSRLVTEASANINVNKDTKLNVDLQEVPRVYGDEDRIRQVVRHLLDNAAKFTKRGNISVEAAKAGEMLKVCVRDTGIGIRNEARGHVFDGFTQADGSHEREHEGLGLGLSISRKIVELHGGRMWFKSRLGRGSEFYFTLPLKPTGVKHHEI